MPPRNRITLKNYFKNGKSPSETQFTDLIDSTFNRVDDGINKTEPEGLMLAPNGHSSTIMSFYESLTDAEPNWQIGINLQYSNGLAFVQPKEKESPALVFSDSGKLGVKTFTPRTEFDVAGNICSNGRLGGLVIGKVPADAKWHTVIDNLKGFNAFEIMAAAEGNEKEGNYSIVHAIALNAHQGRNGKVKITSSTYGWFDFRDRIRIRWIGEENNYALQIRTGKHYFLREKQHVNFVRFHIGKLWDSAVMNAPVQTITSDV